MNDELIYGIHAVSAVLKSNLRQVKKLLASEERADQRIQPLLQLAKQKNIPVEKLSLKKLNLQLGDVAHQGIAAMAGPMPEYSEKDVLSLLAKSNQPCHILILDGVTDPHNLGACLRSANAAGVDFVIIPRDKSASITAAVSKVASGAAECTPLVSVTNLVRTMEVLKQEGVWFYGAAGEADCSLYQLDLKGSVAIVLGAEGDGLRRLTRDRCDGLFSIPMLGSVESLNVSVATGIALYEVMRQRIA